MKTDPILATVITLLSATTSNDNLATNSLQARDTTSCTQLYQSSLDTLWSTCKLPKLSKSDLSSEPNARKWASSFLDTLIEQGCTNPACAAARDSPNSTQILKECTGVTSITITNPITDPPTTTTVPITNSSTTSISPISGGINLASLSNTLVSASNMTQSFLCTKDPSQKFYCYPNVVQDLADLRATKEERCSSCAYTVLNAVAKDKREGRIVIDGHGEEEKPYWDLKGQIPSLCGQEFENSTSLANVAYNPPKNRMAASGADGSLKRMGWMVGAVMLVAGSFIYLS